METTRHSANREQHMGTNRKPFAAGAICAAAWTFLAGCGQEDGAAAGSTVAGIDSSSNPIAVDPKDTSGTKTKGLLRDLHPQDAGMGSDSTVLFYSGFEEGFAGWGWHNSEPDRMAVESATGMAHGGSRYLRASVARAHLKAEQYVSSQAQAPLAKSVAEIFFRFHARFVGKTATPHHWVRVAAGTSDFQSDGLANTVPAGDKGFWFDLDGRSGDIFAFYVYWYKMRSGRCNDGTAVPGCAGDQETTYHYGNNFVPRGQIPFPRDKWFCLEIRAKANAVGKSDGSLALWQNDTLVGEYKPGSPRGRWLRDNFFTWGDYYRPDQDFEGFDFRSSDAVQFKRVVLDAYYQENTLSDSAPDIQTILYDDVVVATSRVGCRK